MPTDNDPRPTLVALSLLHEPNQSSFRALRSVYNLAAVEADQVLNALKGRKLTAGLELTAKGLAFLRSQLPPNLLLTGSKPVDIYRAFVGAKLLSQAPDVASFKALSDGRCVCAAIAVRALDPTAKLPFDNPKAIVSLAIRTVVNDYLVRSLPAVKLAPPTASPIGRDPLIGDLFAAATGHREPDAGFRKLAAKALNTSSIPKTEARWRRLSQAGFDSMARTASQSQQGQVDVGTVVNAVDRISRITPTGWVPIFRVFEAYRAEHRVALADFKAAVEAAARSDKLELAPLNVPSLQNPNERAQSALVMGGLTYHLVRLPK